jgi:DNA-binding NtrC family response regulator
MVASNAAPSRTLVVVSADGALRRRLISILYGMRWQVREAGGGAEAMAILEDQVPEVLLLDHWLPDLEVGEFAELIQQVYPEMELLDTNGEVLNGSRAGPRRNELVHGLRAAANTGLSSGVERTALAEEPAPGTSGGAGPVAKEPAAIAVQHSARPAPPAIEGMAGGSPAVHELARMVALVAPRATTVLISGETGTGKELVAQAIHRGSARSRKPFAVLNCAAIPEALLEAELFGHTRGAFTGAVQSRTGRIEAAHGGTLFLDEIGEMPLGLQAKMLRFLESGELQRVGENDVVHVDVRVVAATHRDLERQVQEGSFRMDLYHRLAVFVVDVPALRERLEDIAVLAEDFLAELGRSAPRKRMSARFLAGLMEFDWPGNVRELRHVLERAVILAEDSMTLELEHLRLRRERRE